MTFEATPDTRPDGQSPDTQSPDAQSRDAHPDAPTQQPTPLSAAVYRFVVLSRCLLFMGFVPTGMVKVLGRPFTTMPADTPMGALFAGLHGSSGLWFLIGAAQVLAGLLLIIPRTRTLGALAFLPVVIGIVAITNTMDFHWTGTITILMLCANLLLLWWDRARVIPAALATLGRPSTYPGRIPVEPHMSRLEIASWVVATTCGLIVLLATRDLAPKQTVLPGLIVGGLASVGIVGAWLLASWSRLKGHTYRPA